MGLIGQSPRRKEDPALITGRGRYVAEFGRDADLFAVVVRSPQAFADLVNVDAGPALSLQGVRAVLTWEDLAPCPTPIPMRVFPTRTIARCLQHVLAHGRVRYVGEPVAVVLADDRYLAEDAAERVGVTYRPLQPVADAASALAAGAPRLFEALPDNVAFETTVGECGDTVWDQAPIVLRETFRTNRHMACPLETRGLVAAYDPAAERLSVWGPTKALYWNREVLARMLDLPEERIRFVEPTVGGAFGLRGEFYPEDYLIPYCAVRFGTSVKWVEDRREHLVAGNHSRQQTYEAEVAADVDGRILGARLTLVHDLGAYVRTNGTVPAMLAATCFAAPYSFPFTCLVRCVLTNKTPTGTYRSPGHFESAFVRERLMDMVAARVGLDPAEVRRRNLIPPERMPFPVGTSVNGEDVVLDSGNYPLTFERALAAGEYWKFRSAPRKPTSDREAVGIGLGAFVEKTGLGKWEYSRAELHDDGGVRLFTGGTSVGQGIDTILSQIVAEHVGVDYDSVLVRHGDTDEVGIGNGAWASRGTIHAGNCARAVALQLKEAVARAAAECLEAAPRDVEVQGGRAFVRGAPHRSIALGEVAARSPDRRIVCEHTYVQDALTYTMGVHVARVAVDRDTGHVRLLGMAMAVDVGRAINPQLVEGQAVGGLAQGIGGALLEELAYNPEGQPLAGTFVDYLLPTSELVPRVRVAVTETASPTNPLGVRGAGECGAAGVGAAIANAVADALRSFGPASLPLAPEHVWRLLQQVGVQQLCD